MRSDEATVVWGAIRAINVDKNNSGKRTAGREQLDLFRVTLSLPRVRIDPSRDASGRNESCVRGFASGEDYTTRVAPRLPSR